MFSSVHGILQTRILQWVAVHSSRVSSQPRDRTQVSCIIRQFFPICATRRPKNIGVCSLSLVQGIFLTQESNWGLLYYRQILSFAQAVFHFGLFFGYVILEDQNHLTFLFSNALKGE